MDKIEINEYVRTTDGIIGKVEKYSNYEYWVKCSENNDIWKCSDKYIVKHSKNLIDLVEVGDVLEIKEDGDIAYVGLEKDTITLTYKEIIEEIKNKKVELLSILTKEMYEQNCYRVEAKDE